MKALLSHMLDTKYEIVEVLRIKILSELKWIAAKNMKKANRKAAKFAQAEITFYFDNERLEKETRQDFNGKSRTYNVSYVDVVVAGKLPKISGYEFLAKIENTEAGPLLKCVPGKTGAVEFVTSQKDFNPQYCDHCKTNRYRKETFALRHEDGTIRQIGRQCLKDFLGCTDPNVILKHLGYMQALAGFDPLDSYSGGYVAPTVFLDTFVQMVTTDIRERGFKSSQYGDSTKEAAMNLYSIKQENQDLGRKLLGRVTEEDEELAEKVIEWAKTQNNGGEYFHNMRIIFTNDIIPNPHRNAGLVASAIHAYQKEMNLVKERATKVQSQFIGTVGERMKDVSLTLKTRINVGTCAYTDRSIILHIFNDDKGNVVTWTTGASSIELEAIVKCDATVKAHKVYQNDPTFAPVNQTQVTRLKVK